MTGLNHMKEKCVGCNKKKVVFTKEHVFPKWLINKTSTDKTGIKWLDNSRKIPASSCTLPLCEDCNSKFGQKLEQPVSNIFDDLENGIPISDIEAELLVRWGWKTYGMFWMALKGDDWIYTEKYNLRERVLSPIDKIRKDIVLAVSRIEEIDPFYGDAPMGIDSHNLIDAVFFSGVFNKIAIIISLREFQYMIPNNFSIYNLKDLRIMNNSQKEFLPKIGFKDDTEAVGITKRISFFMSRYHDIKAMKLQSQYHK